MNRIRNELLSTKEKLVTAETTCIEKLNDSTSKTNALAITSVALKELYAELNKCKKKIAMESNMSSIARQLFKNEHLTSTNHKKVDGTLSLSKTWQ